MPPRHVDAAAAATTLRLYAIALFFDAHYAAAHDAARRADCRCFAATLMPLPLFADEAFFLPLPRLLMLAAASLSPMMMLPLIRRRFTLLSHD